MTPAEKLKEIETIMTDYALPNSTTDGGNLFAEMPWLINRVKQLESALKEHHAEYCSLPDGYKCSTCKALEGEE